MKRFWAAALLAALACVCAVSAQQSTVQHVALPPYQTLTPVRILGYVRRVYREHRPPPAYETYTLVRTQNTNYGYPDYADSYTKHYWVRNVDRAALVRYVYRDGSDSQPMFDRPALNQPRDPGPPTADLFAPAHIEPVTFVPTPEPTVGPLKVIGHVVAFGEFDYNVPKLQVEGDLLHLTLVPKRDPERNVLREIWVDKHTYVLKKVIAHDRLFDEGTGNVYPVLFTYTLGYLDGYVVVTHLDGVVLPEVSQSRSGTITEKTFTGDGQKVRYDFTDITFPASLPSWYFDARSYGAHMNDLPDWPPD